MYFTSNVAFRYGLTYLPSLYLLHTAKDKEKPYNYLTNIIFLTISITHYTLTSLNISHYFSLTSALIKFCYNTSSVLGMPTFMPHFAAACVAGITFAAIAYMYNYISIKLFNDQFEYNMNTRVIAPRYATWVGSHLGVLAYMLTLNQSLSVTLTSSLSGYFASKVSNETSYFLYNYILRSDIKTCSLINRDFCKCLCILICNSTANALTSAVINSIASKF